MVDVQTKKRNIADLGIHTMNLIRIGMMVEGSV